MSNFITSFYSPNNAARDPSNRSLNSILAFSDSELEYHHDYIQYLFPLPERSPVNPRAPVITSEVRQAFLSQPELRSQLVLSLKRMCSFYGFNLAQQASVTITPAEDFQRRAKMSWFKRFDHNHLRITRIIRSLRVLGCENEARTFYNALLENEKGAVSGRSKMYWARAVDRPLYLPPEAEDESDGVKWLREEGQG